MAATCTCTSTTVVHEVGCPAKWLPPERVWVNEKCVLDCVDRGWSDYKSSNPVDDRKWLRVCEYVRADVHEGLAARLRTASEVIGNLEREAMALKSKAPRVEELRTLLTDLRGAIKSPHPSERAWFIEEVERALKLLGPS